MFSTMEDDLELKSYLSSAFDVGGEDILIDILSRLPAKSLLQFKCVSKYWFGLIVSPYFIKSHLHRARSKIIVTVSSDPHITLVSLDHNAGNKATQKYPVLLSPDLMLVGSCNGLVCLSDKKTSVVILNPATNKSIDVPFGIVERKHFDIGFGHDPLTDTYKIVRLDFSYSSSDHIRAHVWTLGTKEWREINIPFRLCSRYYMTYVNGALHWFRLTDNSTWRKDVRLQGDFIVSLDIGSEEFRKVPLNFKRADGSIAMGVLQDCLCVYYFYEDDKGLVDIWLMKEYGVVESWTKLYQICFQMDTITCLRPLSVQENGGTLLQLGRRESPMCGGLYRYDATDDNVKEFWQSEAGPISAESYVESLVSLPIRTTDQEAGVVINHD